MNPDEIPNRLDGTRSTESISATCRHCLHYPGGTRTCTAFPDGIPDALWWAYHGHREPFPGDHGLLFQPRPLPDPLDAARYEIPEFLRKPKP
jgi:hypothetical protein